MSGHTCTEPPTHPQVTACDGTDEPLADAEAVFRRGPADDTSTAETVVYDRPLPDENKSLYAGKARSTSTDFPEATSTTLKTHGCSPSGWCGP